MSILNTINVDTTKEPIFLGQPLGLQRFDRYKYPVFFDLFNKQLTFFWRPEERDLSLDRNQFAELEPHEKRIFTKNLLFQTMLDSVVARGVPSFTQYVTNPELEICLNTWGFFENIHSYSYTYIIKNVYADPSKILDQCLEDPEILKRADSVTKHYDALNEKIEGLDDLRKKIYLSLVSVNILEGLRFYVSFVCAFAFGENKKMMGNANIIKLIRRDENCLDEMSEILTDKGWVKFPELKDTDKVAQYHQDGSIDFVIPNNIIKKEYNGDMISLKNHVGHTDMLLTPEHRVIYSNKNNKIKETLAKDITPHSPNKLILAGKIKSDKSSSLSYYDKFLIALQADGHINDTTHRDGSRCGSIRVTFSFSKQRKIERLREILNNLNFSYKESVYKNVTNFRILIPLEYKISKLFIDWIDDYSKLDYNWCKEFIEEIVLWDGSKNKNDNYKYSSKIESNVDVVQTIASLSDYRTKKSSRKDSRLGKEHHSEMFILSILKTKNNLNMGCVKKDIAQYNGNIYCVSVPTGMFVARRNNGVFITGNCHMFTTQTIINILRTNKDEGFQNIIKECEQEAINMFLSAVEEEKAWAKYLFKDGSILGLNEQILCLYIEWLCDTRMRDLGLPKQFNTKNPIGGWVECWMDSSSVQVAPQETEISSYLISSSVSDVEKTDFSDMSLD